MHKHYVPAEKYYEEKEEHQGMESCGCEIVPVDLQGSLVIFDKHDPANLKKTEENIREKFNI